MLHKLRNFVAVNKFRFSRAGSYVSAIGILFLVSQGIQKYVDVPIYWIYPITLLCVIIVGWIDDKLGFWRTETNYSFQELAIYKKLEAIEVKLNELEARNQKTENN